MKTLVYVLLISVLTLCFAQDVRYIEFKVYDPVYIALEQGYFADEGISVELVGAALGGPNAIQAVAAGSADAGLSSIPALINANVAGLPILGVSDIQSALPGQPLEVYFVRSDSGIDSLEDLPSTTFAVNLWRSSFHYTALMALEQENIPEQDINFVLLGFSEQAAALSSGAVDVIGLMEPYIGSAKATYGDEFYELFNAIDVFGTKQFTLHFVNQDWANDNIDVARAFVAGIVRATEFAETNPAQAAAIIAQYTGLPAEHIPAYKFQEDARVIQDDVAWWIDYLYARGDIDVKPGVGEVASNRFNPHE
jgi:NitT/TauT family transport system substrate-binding protein